MENLKLTHESTKTVEDRTVDTYKVGRYTVKRIGYPSGYVSFTIKKERSEYLPEIYSREDSELNVRGFEIQTTSYGALSARDTKKVVSGLSEAIAVTELLETEFLKQNENKMYFVYMDTPCGTELIGRSETLKGAEKIKADKDAQWEVGFLWHTRITEKEEKEFSCFD